METIDLETTRGVELIDITGRVKESLGGIISGVCIVFTPHTTTGIIVNENEDGLKGDILDLLNEIVPIRRGYRHDRIDDNAHAHLKSLLLGPSVAIPVENGELILGTWQRIFFVELDGPRRRKVYVKMIKG